MVAGAPLMPETLLTTLLNQIEFPGAMAVALKLDEMEYVDGTQRSSNSSRRSRPRRATAFRLVVAEGVAGVFRRRNKLSGDQIIGTGLLGETIARLTG